MVILARYDKGLIVLLGIVIVAVVLIFLIFQLKKNADFDLKKGGGVELLLKVTPLRITPIGEAPSFSEDWFVDIVTKDIQSSLERVGDYKINVSKSGPDSVKVKIKGYFNLDEVNLILTGSLSGKLHVIDCGSVGFRTGSLVRFFHPGETIQESVYEGETIRSTVNVSDTSIILTIDNITPDMFQLKGRYGKTYLLLKPEDKAAIEGSSKDLVGKYLAFAVDNEIFAVSMIQSPISDGKLPLDDIDPSSGAFLEIIREVSIRQYKLELIEGNVVNADDSQ